jgi:hypothetical protein
MPRIAAFDIGIKNLAWCCMDASSKKEGTVKGWANENIITGSTAEDDIESKKCVLCNHKASYWKEKGYCVRHCPPLTPAFRDLSGNLIKKIPSMAVCKSIALKAGADKKQLKTKESTLQFLQTKYCMPIAPAAKVKKIDLEELHDGLQKVVIKNSELFSTCNEILLENQPVFKNPVMKSIQMMLFATLRDLLEGPPKIRLVHAGRKTEGATGGDEGYSERKQMSERKVQGGLEEGTIKMDTGDGRDKHWFLKQQKKSDLADCLCMCLDACVK